MHLTTSNGYLVIWLIGSAPNHWFSPKLQHCLHPINHVIFLTMYALLSILYMNVYNNTLTPM